LPAAVGIAEGAEMAQSSRQRVRRSSTVVVATVVAIVAGLIIVAGATGATATTAGPPKGYAYGFPKNLAYRVLSNDPRIPCDAPDATFEAALQSEHLSGYTGLVTDAEQGTCERRKAEQLKRLHPDTFVLWRTQANNGVPSARAKTWPGYLLLQNRTQATAVPAPTDTSFAVADPERLNADDTALLYQPVGADQFGIFEYVKITSVVGSTITATRAFYGTPATFTAPPFVAAIVTNGAPVYNYSTEAPVNPATGQRAFEWLAQQYIEQFAPNPGQPSLDGIEFDSTQWYAPTARTNLDVRNYDCDADGSIDYCLRDLGTPDQVTTFGLGWSAFVQTVRTGLQAYRGDRSIEPAKVVIGDSGFRAIGAANGAEFESFPAFDDYDQSSAALADLGLFHDLGAAPKVSYAFTKDVTPIYARPGRQNPDGCVQPPLGDCRNGVNRYGLAAALVTGSWHAESDEVGDFDHATPFDEDGGTVNTDVTGLQAGYLGQPKAPAQRQTRYTSTNLISARAKAGDPTAWRVVESPGYDLTATHVDDNAPGHTGGALRVDVGLVPPEPTRNLLQVSTGVRTAIEADHEYTVSFWARADGSFHPGLHQMVVALDGQAAVATIRVAESWRQYFLAVRTVATAPAARLSFWMGRETGDFRFQDIEVHQGSAGLVTRQFDHGIAVLNDGVYPQTDVKLPGGSYRKIAGVQDPVVNDGKRVGGTLPSIEGKDGAILLREVPYAASPNVAVSDADTGEGDAGAHDITFVITLSPPAAGPTTVHFQTTDGSAAGGEDFTPVSGSVTIAEGDAAGHVTVAVWGDPTLEPDETFGLDITGVDRPAVVTRGHGTATIFDDDAAPSVSLGPVSVVEGAAGTTTTAQVPVRLSAPSGRPVTVDWTTAPGSAGPADFVAASGTLTIPAGTVATTIPVTVKGDDVDEPSESFSVGLSGNVGASIDPGGRTGAVRIDDDDGSPSVTVGDTRVVEADGAATFKVRLLPASTKTVTVSYATAPGRAGPDDLTATAGTVTFNPGQTLKTVAVPVVDDSLDEDAESFTLGLSVTGAGTQRKVATATIVDDDAPPGLSLDDVTVVEGDSGTVTAAVPVRLSAPSAKPITLDLATNNLRAQSGPDFTPPTTPFTIPPGTTRTVIPVAVKGDVFDESNETFIVRAVSATNVTLVDGISEVRIDDDDGTPTLSVDDVIVDEGDPAGTVTFTVRALPAPTVDVGFDWFTLDATATAPADYAASSGHVVIPAGSTTATLTVPLVDDTANEPNEGFSVQLANVTGINLLDGKADALIHDDDPPPSVSVGDASTVEGDAGTTLVAVPVTLSAVSGRPVVVDWSTADGTATAGAGYVASAGDLTVAPGATGGTIYVPIVGNTTPEPTTAFTVRLRYPDQAVVGDGTATVTILDDD
jgi:hypothetical protein